MRQQVHGVVESGGLCVETHANDLPEFDGGLMIGEVHVEHVFEILNIPLGLQWEAGGRGGWGPERSVRWMRVMWVGGWPWLGGGLLRSLTCSSGMPQLSMSEKREISMVAFFFFRSTLRALQLVRCVGPKSENGRRGDSE